MNSLEKYVFDKHMQDVEPKYEDFAREIMSLQTPGSFSILYATDTHYIRKYAFYMIAYDKVKEMTEFSKYAGIDLFAITGDLVDGNTTLKRQYRDLYDLVSLIRNAKTTSVALSKGNHDDCSWYSYQHELGLDAAISEEQWYTHVINPIRVQYPITLDENNIAGGYYYIDYPHQKIRVININTNDIENVTDENGNIMREYCGQWLMGVREKQLKWLSKALQFDEPGWSVMLMSHALPVDDGVNQDAVHNGNLVWEMLLAYKNGTKGTAVSSEKYFEANVDYDFTANKSNDVLPYLYGHIHKDMVVVRDGITAVASDTVNKSHNEDGNGDNDFDKPYIKPYGGWDCIVIDKEKRTLKKRRFDIEGADIDIEY